MKQSRMLVFLFLFLAPSAHATTRIAKPPPQSTLLCKARAIFLGTRLSSETFEFRGKEQTARKVFWRLQILDVSSGNASICPQEKEIELRLRGATFDLSSRITYPVDLQEPKVQADISLSLTKISGTDSRSKRPYSEWTFRKYE